MSDKPLNDPDRPSPPQGDPGETPRASDEARSSKKLIELVFPQSPSAGFFIGIAISILLLGLSLYVKINVIGADTVANVLVALATAIVLAAFNGQATVQWGPMVLAGVAASFGGLLYFLEYTDKARWERAQQSYVTGSISGVPANIYTAVFQKQEAFWSNHIKKEVMFVALTGKLEGSSTTRLTMYVKDAEKAPFCKNRKPGTECEELIFDIPADLVRSATRDKRELQWRFNAENATFTDRLSKDRLFGEQDAPRTDDSTEVKRGLDFAGLLHRAVTFAAKAADNGSQLRDALADLTSDDTATRRTARDTLSEGSVEWVAPILKYMQDNGSNYRIKLGGAVALAQMLRSDKSNAKSIQSQLTANDLQLLLKAASDPDRTVRIYASEFLYDLGDPRAALPALELAKAADDNGKYNLILVSRSSIESIKDKNQKDEVRRSLIEFKPIVGDKTRALVESALSATN